MYAHGLPVARELQGEVLLPGVEDDAVADGGDLLLAQAHLVGVEDVHLLAEDGEGGLGGLSHLLVAVLGVVVIHGGVVTQRADRGHLDQCVVLATVHLLAAGETGGENTQKNQTWEIEGGSCSRGIQSLTLAAHIVYKVIPFGTPIKF